MSLLSRIMNAFRSRALDRDLDDEQRFHIEARAADLVSRGASPAAAGREARRQFGNQLLLRECSREARLMPRLESLLHDLRYGVRVLRKMPTVTIAAVLTLSLATGACTAAFALIDALILRPLPVRDPHGLIYLTFSLPDQGREAESFNYPLFERLREAARGKAELFIASSQDFPRDVKYQGGGGPDKLRLQYVSGNMFELLGLRPALGRLIEPADDKRPGAGPVAVLSYVHWMRRFGGDPAVLGKWFSIGNQQFRIVGVAPKGFSGLEPGWLTDTWVPAMMWDQRAFADDGWSWFRIAGRLHPGVSAARAEQAMEPIFRNFIEHRIAGFRADTPRDRIALFRMQRLHVASAANGPSTMRRDYGRPLWILAGIAALVLLIACSNLANLLTARAAAREREMAMRSSIGAGRGRLIQQALAECALLAAAASIGGLVIAMAAAPAMVNILAPASNPAYLDLRLDWRVAAAVIALGVAALLLSGLAPAWRASGAAPQDVLRPAGPGHTGQSGILRPVIAAQIGLSFTVLFLGGLLLSSFHKLLTQDLGFSSDGVMVYTIQTPKTPESAQIPAALDLLDRVRALPQVRAASFSEMAMFGSSSWTSMVRIPGRAPDSFESHYLAVSPRFFETMSIRMLAGRDFTPADALGHSSTVIVNESFARRYFPGVDPIGRRFSRNFAVSDIPQEIVGIVRDAKYNDPRSQAPPTVYIPLRGLGRACLEVRAAGDPAAVIAPVRAQIQQFGRGVAIADVTPQSTLVNNALILARLLALLSGFFALAALALAAIGLYGVLNYSVVRRTREIGIRVALGARRGAMARLILRDVFVVTGIGLAAGGLAGRYLAAELEKLLYEIKPTDALAFALPLAGLLLVAAAAALRPALKASSVDPAIALRYE